MATPLVRVINSTTAALLNSNGNDLLENCTKDKMIMNINK